MRNDQRYLLAIGLLTTGLTVGWLFATIAYAELGYGTYRLRVPLFGDLAADRSPQQRAGIGRWYQRAIGVASGAAVGRASGVDPRMPRTRAALLILALSPHSEDLTPLTAWMLLLGVIAERAGQRAV
ncbi:MAG: hypothetical protein KatS3mg055_0543 [Chloroflexus sp.]|uniref:hypothetical protein n=1 Tax=Chloroflexus sp. TaxID=1904827 RepID=UPI0021DE68EB|nr:hypothetical protein [Chloroflexus sp.]GIV88025.1 MAG: hypothetical protein KatS3mg055_0543 [Chloroflexus sp.]